MPAIQSRRWVRGVLAVMSKSFRDSSCRPAAGNSAASTEACGLRAKSDLGRGALFRSERYDIWHNVASPQGPVKSFTSDHYEKEMRQRQVRPPRCVADTPRRRSRSCRRRRAAGRSRSTARPRSSKAMHVFWEHGYEAASIADLTAAMGITPPSLYTAFGDKEHCSSKRSSLRLGPGGFGARALAEEPTARGAVQRLLEEAADELTQACHPLGCMMVCSVAAKHVQAALAKRRAVGRRRACRRASSAASTRASCRRTPMPARSPTSLRWSTRACRCRPRTVPRSEPCLPSVALAMRSWPDAPPKPARAASPRRAPVRASAPAGARKRAGASAR